MKKKTKRKKKPTFSKKDWNEIFTRAFSVMTISMLTQAMKNSTFGGKPIQSSFFTKPTTKTPNPAFATFKRRKP